MFVCYFGLGWRPLLAPIAKTRYVNIIILKKQVELPLPKKKKRIVGVMVRFP